MNRSKLVFAGFVVVFFILLFYASYDIASRTTFPGSKPQLKERIKDRFVVADTTKPDSLRIPQTLDTLQ